MLFSCLGQSPWKQRLFLFELNCYINKTVINPIYVSRRCLPWADIITSRYFRHVLIFQHQNAIKQYEPQNL